MAIRRDPFAEMDRMIDQMRRSMMDMGMRPMDFEMNVDSMDRDVDDESLMGPRSFRGSMGRRDNNLTMQETDEGFVVVADIPGFETEEIDLRFDDGIMTVRAERDLDEESEGLRRLERRSVVERISIPGDVVEDEISATYRNGVLEVTLPAMEASLDESRRIDID